MTKMMLHTNQMSLNTPFSVVKCPHKLVYLNTWSLGGSAVEKGFGVFRRWSLAGIHLWVWALRV